MKSNTLLKELPPYFVIKWDGTNPLWDEYINWLNQMYDDEFVGQSGRYYGIDQQGGCVYAIASLIPDWMPLITLEQWNELVNGVKEVTFEDYLKEHPYPNTNSFSRQDWESSMYDNWVDEKNKDKDVAQPKEQSLALPLRVAAILLRPHAIVVVSQ